MNIVILTLQPLIVHSDGVGTSATSNNPLESLHLDESVEPTTAVDKDKSNQESAMPTTARLLRGVRDSPNAFGPLRSIAGALCLIMENCTVCSLSHVFNPQCLQSLRRQGWIYRP